jgi:hypothetical protein
LCSMKILRQPGVDRLHALEIALQGPREMLLSGEIGAVRDPDGERLRAQHLAELDAFDVMRHRLRPCRRVGMRQAAELVGMLLVGLVLESVGIDRVEAEAELVAELLHRMHVLVLVPGEMQRDGRRRPGQLLDRGAVLELVEHVARLADAGEAGEARAAGADAPARNRDAEAGDRLGDGLDVGAGAPQLAAQRLIILVQRRQDLGVLLGDIARGDAVGPGHGGFLPEVASCYRLNETALPASTFRMLPVDFGASVQKNFTAAAMSSG